MNFLKSIVEQKREEVASVRTKRRISALMESEHFRRPALSLREGLERRNGFAIIAEIKRSSPTAGTIRESVDPAATAQAYADNGAAGISVLTDERYFSGVLDDLRSVRHAVNLPVLRKDFIIDEYQILEAKAYGADAVLLIAAILDRPHLRDLFSAAAGLGLECLVELYESAEIDILDFDAMKLIGVNNRDLRTFRVDVEHTLRMKELLPPGLTLVAESGIRTAENIALLRSGGIRAALIGEHFMKSPSPGKALAELLRSIDHEATS